MLDPKFKAIVQDFFKRSAINSIHNHQNALFAGQEMASIATLTEALAAHDAHLKNFDSYKPMASGHITEIVDSLITDNSWLKTEIGQSDPSSARVFVQREYLKFMREVITGALALHQDPGFTPEQAEPLPLQIQPSATSPLFSEAWKEFVLEKSHGWTVPTRSMYESYAAEFSSNDFTGDKHLHELNRGDMIRFRNKLQRLPAQRKKLKAYRDKTVAELINIDIPADQRMKGRTINEMLSTLKSFFNWCRLIKKYMQDDIMHDVLLRNVESATRAPFTDDELRLLFDPTSYRERTNSSFKFWLPLLGLYTGARIGELAQLHTVDIIETDGVMCFCITDEGDDQSVKTLAGIRHVPIHQVLIEIGILEYVDQLRAQGTKRLFPELRLGEHKPGDAASKWFTKFRRLSGIPDSDSIGRKKVFHCFRHTMITRLQQAEQQHPIPIIQQIVGHEKSLFGATSGYTGDFPLSACKQAINTFAAPTAVAQLRSIWPKLL